MSRPHISRDLSIRLNELLAGDLTREEFRRWFAPILWSADELDDDLAAIAYDVELAFAEIDAGHWSTEQFNRELRSIDRRARSLAAA